MGWSWSLFDVVIVWRLELGVEKGQNRHTHKFFLRAFGPAFLEAFTPETVKTAFSATGIYPFRRGVVSPEQMGPSEALTTNPSVPGILATPVRKVISAFSYYHSPPVRVMVTS